MKYLININRIADCKAHVTVNQTETTIVVPSKEKMEFVKDSICSYINNYKMCNISIFVEDVPTKINTRITISWLNRSKKNDLIAFLKRDLLA